MVSTTLPCRADVNNNLKFATTTQQLELLSDNHSADAPLDVKVINIMLCCAMLIPVKQHAQLGQSSGPASLAGSVVTVLVKGHVLVNNT